jgi:MFS family permease
MRENNNEASSALKWLRGPQYDPTEEIAELQNDNEEQKANNLSAVEALTRPTSIRGLVICFGLMFFQQVSGINAVIFYTTDIFKAAGTGIDPEIATIIVGVMQVVATFVASLVVDRLGRRLLLLVSDSVMALCTLVLGIYFFMKSQDASSVDSIGWIPIVALCVFIVTFSLGFGPVPWLMMGELFASDVKGIAAPLTGTLNWFLGEIFIVKSFCGLSVLGTVFVFLVVPETKGKSLNEIQLMLSGDHKVSSNGSSDEQKI